MLDCTSQIFPFVLRRFVGYSWQPRCCKRWCCISLCLKKSLRKRHTSETLHSTHKCLTDFFERNVLAFRDTPAPIYGFPLKSGTWKPFGYYLHCGLGQMRHYTCLIHTHWESVHKEHAWCKSFDTFCSLLYNLHIRIVRSFYVESINCLMHVRG